MQTKTLSNLVLEFPALEKSKGKALKGGSYDPWEEMWRQRGGGYGGGGFGGGGAGGSYGSGGSITWGGETWNWNGRTYEYGGNHIIVVGHRNGGDPFDVRNVNPGSFHGGGNWSITNHGGGGGGGGTGGGGGNGSGVNVYYNNFFEDMFEAVGRGTLHEWATSQTAAMGEALSFGYDLRDLNLAGAERIAVRLGADLRGFEMIEGATRGIAGKIGVIGLLVDGLQTADVFVRVSNGEQWTRADIAQVVGSAAGTVAFFVGTGPIGLTCAAIAIGAQVYEWYVDN